MESSKNLIELLFDKIKEYGLTTYELAKLKLLKNTVVIVPSLLSRLIVFLVFFTFILILSIGIAFYLGDLLGKIYYGFFIIALFYLIAGFVFHFFLHKWIKKPLGNIIIKEILQQ